MKTKKEEISKEVGKGAKLTRKQAISKAGFVAISAATTMMLLSNPNAAHAVSAPAAPAPSDSGGVWTKRT